MSQICPVLRGDGTKKPLPGIYLTNPLAKWFELGASSNLVPFGRWWDAAGRGHCRGKSGQWGGYAPDWTRVESGLSPWCDPLTSVSLCDDERD